MTVAKCFCQRREIDHRAAARIDEVSALFHFCEAIGVHQVLGSLRARHVKSHDVRRVEQVFKPIHGFGVAEGELRKDVIEDHIHPDCLGQSRHLGADVSVANDAERFAANFDETGREFFPDPLVHLDVPLAEPTREHDDLREHHFCDASGVSKRRVKDRDSECASLRMVDLIGSDAEAPDREEALCLGEHLRRHLGFAADSEHMNVSNFLRQCCWAERTGKRFDLKTLLREALNGQRMDVFEQEYFDLIFWKGGRRSHGCPTYRRKEFVESHGFFQ